MIIGTFPEDKLQIKLIDDISCINNISCFLHNPYFGANKFQIDYSRGVPMYVFFEKVYIPLGATITINRQEEVTIISLN